MKKIFTFILVGLIIIFGYYFYQNKISTTKKSVVQQQNITVYLKLIGQTDFIKQVASANQTALDFTKEKAKVTTKGEGSSAYVVKINSKLAEDSKKEFFAFYINDKMAEVGAGSYKLRQGDKIEWKIEKY